MQKYKRLLQILILLGIVLLLLAYPSWRLDREAYSARRDAGSQAAEVRHTIWRMCMLVGVGLLIVSSMWLNDTTQPITIKYSWRRAEVKGNCIIITIGTALILVPIVYGACFYTRFFSALDNGGMLNPLTKPLYETLKSIWIWCIGLFMVSLLLWSVFGRRRLRKYRVLEGHICPECTYPLKGLPPGSRCPECGQDLADTVSDTCPESVNANTSQEG